MLLAGMLGVPSCANAAGAKERASKLRIAALIFIEKRERRKVEKKEKERERQGKRRKQESNPVDPSLEAATDFYFHTWKFGYFQALTYF